MEELGGEVGGGRGGGLRGRCRVGREVGGWGGVDCGWEGVR